MRWQAQANPTAPALPLLFFGCPPGLHLSREAVQAYLDRRRPGSNKHGTPRHEADRVVFLSGLYQTDHDALTTGPSIQINTGDKANATETYEAGQSTGEPIAALVLSASKKSAHYEQFAGPQGEVRPGHTDLVKYHKAQGHIDIRGGGRSSYRSTISDVIGGSIARIYLQEKFQTFILSSICQVGPLKAKKRLADQLNEYHQSEKSHRIPLEKLQALEKSMAEAEIYSLDADFAQEAGALIKKTRIDGDSLGAQVEVVAVNVPSLVGDPLYQSLKLKLMGSLGGLHAVQACEIGSGVAVASRLGSENNDPIRQSGYQSNHHGGLIGGITTGSPLSCTISFKPTSTIIKAQNSVRKNLEEIEFLLEKGRHDPCVGVRAGVTLESRMAIELMNAVLGHNAAWVDVENFQLF